MADEFLNQVADALDFGEERNEKFTRLQIELLERQGYTVELAVSYMKAAIESRTKNISSGYGFIYSPDHMGFIPCDLVTGVALRSGESG